MGNNSSCRRSRALTATPRADHDLRKKTDTRYFQVSSGVSSPSSVLHSRTNKRKLKGKEAFKNGESHMSSVTTIGKTIYIITDNIGERSRS